MLPQKSSAAFCRPWPSYPLADYARKRTGPRIPHCAPDARRVLGGALGHRSSTPHPQPAPPTRQKKRARSNWQSSWRKRRVQLSWGSNAGHCSGPARPQPSARKSTTQSPNSLTAAPRHHKAPMYLQPREVACTACHRLLASAAAAWNACTLMAHPTACTERTGHKNRPAKKAHRAPLRANRRFCIASARLHGNVAQFARNLVHPLHRQHRAVTCEAALQDRAAVPNLSPACYVR